MLAALMKFVDDEGEDDNTETEPVEFLLPEPTRIEKRRMALRNKIMSVARFLRMLDLSCLLTTLVS